MMFLLLMKVDYLRLKMRKPFIYKESSLAGAKFEVYGGKTFTPMIIS